MASEVVVLRVDNDRGQCCHAGGDIDFDAAGNLYLTTGDDTNPFESNSYTLIDERTNRNPQFDAQRSSGNTNDLRGKVLRIKPQANGTYTIPSGNLFAPGTANTRPEIYAMGLRNPFRMSVDKATGIVYLGDYGPDAGAGRRQPRSERPGRVQPHHLGGQLRLALLHRHQHHGRDLQRVHVPERPVAGQVQLRERPDEQLLPQHRPPDAAPGQAGLDPLRRRRGLPAGVRRRLGVADGRSRLPRTTRAAPRRSSSRSRSTAASSPVSTAAAGSRPSR